MTGVLRFIRHTLVTPRGVFFLLFFGTALFVLHARSETPFGNYLVYQPGEQVGAVMHFVLLPLLVIGLAVLIQTPPARFRSVSLRLVLCGATALALLWWLIPPLISRDVYYSFYYGQAITEGVNPYSVTIGDRFVAPFAALTDPIFFNLPTPYGPIWQGVSSMVVRLAALQPLVGVLLLRLLVLPVFLVVVWCIGSLAERRWGGGAYAAALFGWNPLALLYFFNEAHNDIFLLLGFALAAVFLDRRRYLYAGLALIVGGLFKWVPLLLLPLVAAAARSERPFRSTRRLGVILAGLAVLAVVVGFLPFWDGANPLAGILKQTGLLNLTFFLAQGAFFLGSADHSTLTFGSGSIGISGLGLTVVKAFGFLLFIGLSAHLLLRVIRQKISWSEAGYLQVFLFLVFSISWFMPWYVFWLVPFAALHPAYLRLTAIITAGFLGAFFFPPHIALLFFLVFVAALSLFWRIREVAGETLRRRSGQQHV
ncbi:MAG: hypothetical protein HY340_03815 [Candidatus Kerfeldbacteria bacterium]|nr:hypothetical protein [Candidatus Kerfeldbacteria bacterium]